MEKKEIVEGGCVNPGSDLGLRVKRQPSSSRPPAFAAPRPGRAGRLFVLIALVMIGLVLALGLAVAILRSL